MKSTFGNIKESASLTFKLSETKKELTKKYSDLAYLTVELIKSGKIENEELKEKVDEILEVEELIVQKNKEIEELKAEVKKDSKSFFSSLGKKAKELASNTKDFVQDKVEDVKDQFKKEDEQKEEVEEVKEEVKEEPKEEEKKEEVID